MRKNLIYQKIDEALRKLATFQSSVYNNVPHNNPLTNSGEELVSSVERDSAVVGLRFLSIFYGCGPHSFSLATNLLDSLLGQVKVGVKLKFFITLPSFLLIYCFNQFNVTYLRNLICKELNFLGILRDLILWNSIAFCHFDVIINK